MRVFSSIEVTEKGSKKVFRVDFSWNPETSILNTHWEGKADMKKVMEAMGYMLSVAKNWPSRLIIMDMKNMDASFKNDEMDVFEKFIAKWKEKMHIVSMVTSSRIAMITDGAGSGALAMANTIRKVKGDKNLEFLVLKEEDIPSLTYLNHMSK